MIYVMSSLDNVLAPHILDWTGHTVRALTRLLFPDEVLEAIHI